MSKMFVIRDNEGFYASPRSFQKLEEEKMYISYTGITTGFTAWDNREIAEKVLNTLNKENENFGHNKTFEIFEVPHLDIGLGVRFIENI